MYLKLDGLQYSVIQNEEIFLSDSTKYSWLTYLLNEFLNTLYNVLVELENKIIFQYRRKPEDAYTCSSDAILVVKPELETSVN